MPANSLNRFFVSIVLPSILAIGLYILSIFIVILPSFERNIMDAKKDMISELTNTAWSLVDEYKMEVENNGFPEDSAKQLAAERIRKIRYGDEYKDYFWIIDKEPVMIMHPYRPELIGQDLNNYKDPDGKLLFVEATKVVKKNGEGFIDYMWQWKDDSTRIVPKLSFVREFAEWHWIIGTGIYLEDVKQEIRILQNRLLRVALIITLVISIILGFIIRQSLFIERKREKAEQNLKLSRLKYKSLVDASTEGTLMIIDDEIIYSNVKFSNLSGYDPFELRSHGLDSIFNLNLKNLIAEIDDPKKSVSRETILNCRDGSKKDIVISVSMITYSEKTGFILVIKEVSAKRQFKKDEEVLTNELQDSLLLMNQPLSSLKQELKWCTGNETIRQVAEKMTRKDQNIMFIKQDEKITGVVNNNDLKKRVLAEGLNPESPVADIMTSPVISLPGNALLHEGILLMNKRNISHIAIKEATNKLTGVVGYTEITAYHQNTVSFLISEIESAEHTDTITRLYKRLNVLVKALIESGDKTEAVIRIITSVNDAVHHRIIELATEDHGPAPCRFAFMVMGSEGRKEQTLATDQDNAIVFEDLPEENQAKAFSYFHDLAEKINTDLNTVGYHYCKGDVMAKNPKWTQPISVWKKYFTNWINDGNPQDILEASIFFEFRGIYGDETLVDQLREHVDSASDNKAVFFYHMAQGVMKFKPSMNVFGKITGKEGESDEVLLDIKKGIFPVVSFIRLYSIQNKIRETNSMERANILFSKKIIEKSIYQYLTESFHFMTYLRLRAQAESIMENEVPGNLINLNKLSGIEIMVLKKMLSEIGELQTKVGFDFKGME